MDKLTVGMTTVPQDAMGMDEEEYLKMTGFHKRYNRALLDKLTLARERDRLAQENAELQSVLAQVCVSGATVEWSVTLCA